AEIVILSVPFRSQSETMTNIKSALSSGQLLVDATVPLAAAVSGKATRTLGVWQGSVAQQALEMAPDGVRVVSASHTVSGALLSDLDHELDEDVLICGDRSADKEELAALVGRIDGLRAVDCGPLEMARFTEQLAPLIISINVRHKVKAGIKITGLCAAQSRCARGAPGARSRRAACWTRRAQKTWSLRPTPGTTRGSNGRRSSGSGPCCRSR